MSRFVCIHGHFYQPPRENGWLETVELQDSANPYHDWNERITAECYGPNARARVMDGNGKIIDLANNYARMSFNFGPTLLSWMQKAYPEIHELIVQADKQSMEHFSGHGSALAQVYNHMILPLANVRDKKTQVIWGIRDFEARFGRRPEGMWLPETAVDTESLEVLADHGIQFTILSPFQARQTRLIGSEEWTNVDGGKIDPRRTYLCELPSGRNIALFFYDGGLSRAVAFEKLQANGEALAKRLIEAFSEDGEDELVHIATDGESYGHHLAYGDMALAWALRKIDINPDVKLTNYGEYLEKHPPKYEAAIHEKSAWSCYHGVGRWCTDCGCNSGGHSGWNQAWRKPLRAAFDWLRDVTAPLFENEANRYLKDPWRARDEYISVVLDRSPESLDDFFARCAVRPLDACERSEVLKLLELQRHAMLMYTSCGWFFDELSGIETVQVIQYAGRVIELCQSTFGLDLEPQFLERLAEAKSNIPEYGDGREIYLKWIKPGMVTLNQATAHYAIESLFQTDFEQPQQHVFVFTFEGDEREVVTSGKARLVIGHTAVTSDITGETAEVSYAVFYMGEHNLTAGVRSFVSQEVYQETAADLKATFDEVDFPKLIRAIGTHFGDPIYSLKSLFKDAQRQVLGELLKTTRADLDSRFRLIAERYVPLMKFLGSSAKSLLPAVETASTFVLRMDLSLQLSADWPDIEKLRRLIDEARQKGDVLMDADLSFSVKGSLKRHIGLLVEKPEDLDRLRILRQVAELTIPLPLQLNLWRVQNLYWAMLHSVDTEVLKKVREGDLPSLEWHREFMQLGACLGFALDGVELKT